MVTAASLIDAALRGAAVAALCRALCLACSRAWSGHVSPGLPPAGRCARCSRGPGGGVAVRLLLRKFKQVLGSHRVLIKCTGIVAVVAVPQLWGPMWGSKVVLNHPWAWWGRGGSGWVPLWSATSGGSRTGVWWRRSEKKHRSFSLCCDRAGDLTRHISPWSNFLQGGRKHRLEKIR